MPANQATANQQTNHMNWLHTTSQPILAYTLSLPTRNPHLSFSCRISPLHVLFAKRSKAPVRFDGWCPCRNRIWHLLVVRSMAPVLEATRQPRCEATGAVTKKNKPWSACHGNSAHKTRNLLVITWSSTYFPCRRCEQRACGPANCNVTSMVASGGAKYHHQCVPSRCRAWSKCTFFETGGVWSSTRTSSSITSFDSCSLKPPAKRNALRFPSRSSIWNMSNAAMHSVWLLAPQR